MPLLNAICHLAKAKNTAGLAKLLDNSGVLIDFQQGLYSPIMLLAEQGEHEAVEFLIRQFGASLDEAVFGYAAGGHETAVNALLAQGASLNEAVRGYAQGGHETAVNALLVQGAFRNQAILGYAKGGHETAVNALLAQGASLDAAAFGYARGGHETAVNALLAQGASRDYAVEGYAEGGYLSKTTNLSRLMALTDDIEFRRLLAQHAPNNSGTLFFNKSTAINQAMKKNNTSYFFLPAFKPDLQTFFWQGSQLLKATRIRKSNNEETIRPALDKDLLLHISSFVSDFSNKQTHDFLSRHKKVTTTQGWAMGKHQLFKREDNLISNSSHDELFITKEELVACLALYNAGHVLRFFGSLADSNAITALKKLLKKPNDLIFYSDIHRAIAGELNQLDDPECQSRTKKVLQMIAAKFDEKLASAINVRPELKAGI